jgi:hypothetical protein
MGAPTETNIPYHCRERLLNRLLIYTDDFHARRARINGLYLVCVACVCLCVYVCVYVCMMYVNIIYIYIYIYIYTYIPCTLLLDAATAYMHEC